MSGTRNGWTSAGLLLLRLGIGITGVLHGLPKIGAGPEKWVELGEAMSVFGITFVPVFWGFMAAFSETFGAVALLTGVLFRPFCVLLAITMLVAAGLHISMGDGFATISHPVELLIVYISLLVSGPGDYNLARFVPNLRDNSFG